MATTRSTSKELVASWLIPSLRDIVLKIDDAYERSTTQRKHVTKGVPIDLVALALDVVERGTEEQSLYLLICFAMAYGHLPQVPPEDVSTYTLQDIQRCLPR